MTAKKSATKPSVTAPKSKKAPAKVRARGAAPTVKVARPAASRGRGR